MAHITLVEDDPDFAALTARFLGLQGHTVKVNAGVMPVEEIRREQPELVILDLELPNESGLSICQRLSDFYRGPILMLTARDRVEDEVLGFEYGADDYLSKPVVPRLLALRVEALLRRSAGAVSDAYDDDDLSMNPETRTAAVRGNPIELTTAEFDLLRFLVERVGQPASREDFYTLIRGIEYDGLDRTYDIKISQLRKKLVQHGLPKARIKTIRGIGYQLTRPEGPR